MERFIENHPEETFDLIVIGGGITGAAVAYDAASRGLDVALVEKQDFGCATSAATAKLIHGGFRYLANMELGLVRESLRERRKLENIAPNFVYPLPSMLTAYNKGLTNNLVAIWSGMLLYNLLSFDKGRTWDRSKRIPSCRMMGPEKIIRLEPNVEPRGLKGGGVQYDCACLCPERLTLTFIKSAVKEGARVSNYAKVEEFLVLENGKVAGVRIKDLIRDETVDLRGRLTVNCAGPWADLVLGLLKDGRAEKKLRRSEGIHIITRNVVNDHLVAVLGESGSHFFLLPWRDHTLIGTTDKEYIGDPDDYVVTREAIMELLDEVNGSFGGEPLKYEDVLHAYGGLRPLVEDQTKDTYESSRKYEIYDNADDGFDGLITVEGGKYTTSRGLAENAMKVVASKLGTDLGECPTDKQRLAGCDIYDVERFIAKAKRRNTDFDEKTVDWLGRQYGTEMEGVLDLARSDEALSETLDSDGEIAAQVVYAAREEMAMTLNDILLRRTGIGTLGYPGEDVVEKVAAVAARELGWDDDRRAEEISQATEALTLP